MFGVNCEALPRQVNFITDEEGECGKGANVSRLHFYMKTHGFGEKVAFLHAHNCTGQNKNNCMVQYLVWRALTKRHTSITLIPSCRPYNILAGLVFWSFKHHFCRTKIGTLKGIAQAVNDSAECNFAQLVCNEDGSTIVPTYDWTDFFAPQLKKISGIKKYHHFRCDSSKPGRVYVEHADTAEVSSGGSRIS